MQVLQSSVRLTTGALVSKLIFTMFFQASFAFCALSNFGAHDWLWGSLFTLPTIVWTGVLRIRLINWKNYK